jgi:hypothetical protein
MPFSIVSIGSRSSLSAVRRATMSDANCTIASRRITDFMGGNHRVNVRIRGSSATATAQQDHHHKGSDNPAPAAPLPQYHHHWNHRR